MNGKLKWSLSNITILLYLGAKLTRSNEKVFGNLQPPEKKEKKMSVPTATNTKPFTEPGEEYGPTRNIPTIRKYIRTIK